MSNPKMFAQWILDNQDKQGTEDFNLVAQAFEKSLQDEQALQQPEEKPFGVAEYAQAPLELGKAVTRGLGGALLSSAAGLAELADIATDRLGFEDLIDSGEDNELIRLANAGQEALQETLGASEPYRDLWFTKFGEGVGSVGAFFLPTGILGAAGRAAGLAAKTTTGLQTAGAITAGGGMMVDDSVNRVADARLRGIEVTKDQEDAAAALSFLVGGLEAFTPLQVLKKIRGLKDPELAKQQFDAIRSVIKTGTGEGIQEVTSGLLMDAIQYGIYDENVPFGESMWDDFTIGAASGALVDAITTGMFNRRSRLSREVELDREKLIREEEERQREDYYNKVALAEESLKERDIQNQLDAIAAQEDAELAAADVLNFQVNQSEQEAFLGLTERYQPSQEALRQPKGDIEGRDIESTVTKQGREYARQIARNASKKAGLFPSTGRFEIREEQGGPSGTNYVVYNTADGRQYGQATKDLEFAKHFSLGLNNEMINKSVNESIIDAMDMSPEAYDPKTAESIFMIGQRLNRPKSYTISEATLNEAAGTVASKDKPFLENLTLDQIHQIQYGVPPFQDGKKKLYKDLKNLTASQQINFERAKKGLPPLREFTLQEAKDALGDKYDKVFDVLLDVQQPDLAAIRQEFGEAGVNVQGGRQRYQDEINTLKEVKDTLASKNIVSDIGSKELSYVFKKITGESSVSKMTPSQRMFLVGELKKLPALDKPSKLPDLSPKPYTRADFNNAMNYVISTGDGTVDNIKAVLPEDLSEKRKSVAAGQIRAELLSRGVINKDNTVSELTALPAPEPRKPTEVTEKDFTTEQSVEALDFQKKLSEALKGFGLDDIRVSILDQMKTKPEVTRDGRLVDIGSTRDFSAAEGLFDPRSRTIFLGLDSARTNARDQSPEAFDFALSEVMDHEIVHAFRNLDLWTQKEFSLLENTARKLNVPGTNKTFYQDAIERYVTQQPAGSKLSPVQAMEEAIAELVRYSKKDRKIIGGKPRNLIDRIFEFFRRLGSAMQGTGFNSMNDLINDIESGALGARERGVVRTARGMEAARRAVPERGIGLARDVKEFRVVEEDEQPVEGGVQMSAQRASDSYKGPVKPYHMDEWTQETGLSPQEIEGFWKLGYDQRGKPEQLMMKAQKEMGGGVLSQAIEHVGDLTNRMTPNHSLGFAYEESLGKAQRILRDLKREYGFRKEAEENLRNAAEYYNIPLEEYKSKVNSALDAYADAHEELVTYNPLQTLARDAAVALGRRDFEKATELLQEFVDRIPTQKDFVAEMQPSPKAGQFAEDGVQASLRRRYTGAPKGMDSPQALGRLRSLIRGLTEEGEGGRFWYERSGQALLDVTGGDKKKAKQLAQAVAITSPQTPVATNFDYAIQAYYQHEAGVPISTGMYPQTMSQKLQDIFDGKDWDGRKTNNFYKNIMRKIDPSLKQGVTTDLWIMRAFGYNSDFPTDPQYDFVEKEIDRLRKELGWEPQQVQAAMWVSIKGRMEAKEVKERTEKISTKKGYMHYETGKDGKKFRVIDNESKHRGVWIAEALKYNPTGKDKDQAKFDFEDAMTNSLAQISWESIPGATADHMPEIFDAEYPVLQQYHVDMSKAFLDENGNDLISKYLGMLSPGNFEAPGYFEGRVSPGSQTKIVAPRRYKAVDLADIDKKLREGVITKEEAETLREQRLDPQSEDLIAAYAAVRGILMKQDGVGFHRPFYNKSLRKGDLNAVEIDIGRPFTKEETANFAQILSNISGHGEFNPIGSVNGVRLINFDYLLPEGKDYADFNDRKKFNDSFKKMVDTALKEMIFEDGVEVSAKSFYAKAGYLGNNWKENKNGEGYMADIAARSPDLSRRVYDIVRKIQPRIEAVDQEYASKFGWRINDSINRVFRSPDPTTGRADQANYGATVRGAVRPNGNLALTHYANKKIDVTNPLLSGTGADRFKRNKAPNAIWYGITDAEISPYQRESMIPQVENKFEIPLKELYVIADYQNENAPRDPLNAFTKDALGDVDYEATLSKVTENGYSGFIVNATNYGKIAVIRKPLKAIEETDTEIDIPEDGILESLKRVDGIIERNPAESITRIYDESATRPFLEEQEINGYPPFSWQAKTYSVGDKIVYQMADKLIGLKKAEEGINRYRALAGLPPIKNKDSAYVGEESIPGKIGIEVKDFQENVQRPYAKKIADSGIPIEELDEFLTFRHAVERNNRIQLRDPSRNVETNPGSGSLKTGERLSNFYVKQIMENRYGYEWDDASGSWVGGNDRGKKLMDLAADADSIVNSTIDRMIQGGLLSKDNAEALRGLYKYYAPLKGKAQEDDFADFVAVGSGLSTKGKEYKIALGRESASESPLGHIMLNAERTIARSVKNESFGQKLVKLIKDNPNSDFWNVYSSSDPRFKQAVDTHYTYIGKESGMQGQRYPDIPKGMDRKDFVKYVVIKQDGLAKFDGDLIGAKDGEEFFVELKDERLRRAILSVNASEADNLIRKFSMVNRFLSMMNTSLNPEFVVGNFSRDLQTAIYNIVGEQTMQGGKIKDVKRITRRVLKDVIPSMGIVYKGMRRYNMKDGTLRSNITGISEADYLDFREFMESGAKADWFYTRPAEEQVQTIQSMVDMANGTFTGNFRKGYEGVMNFVEDANGSVENAVRFAAFKAARDELLNSGVDRAEAVATASTLAKNLTVNFNRKGMQGDLLNALYLFYNASVQGTMNFARGLNVFDPGSSRTKQAMVASMIGFGALMAARGEEESEENPDSGRSYYSEIPDYIKERNIVIMAEPSEAPKKGASNIYLDKNGKEYANKAQYYYTIPLPYGYNVFHVAGVKLFEMKNDTISVEKASGDLLSTFLGSFSPIGFFPLPTITQPFWELAKNENYFGSPIYKENFPTGVQSPASQLAMSSTRTPFKNAAKILNSLTGGNEYESGYMDVSPDALEHIAEFALGGAGTFGLRSMNAFEKWMAGEELESREVPFLRRVMGEPDKNIAVADYYDRKVKLEQKEAAIQGLRGADRIKYREQNQDYVTMFGVLNSIERKLRKVRQMESQLRSRAALSPANAEQYATGLEVLEERKQKLYDQFNKLYDKRVGRTK
jgi:hypothetical protein